MTEAPYEDDDDFEDDGDQPGPDGTGGAQENAYTGPGPDVGPQASGFRGDPQEAFRRGAPRPLGNVEPPLGHGVGMGAPAPGPSQPPVRWAAHVVPFPLSFGYPGPKFLRSQGFCPLSKATPPARDTLSNRWGFSSLLAFSLTPPECSPPVQAGGKIPFHRHTAVDLGAHVMEFFLIVGHNPWMPWAWRSWVTCSG